MPLATKACNLTEDEVKGLIDRYGFYQNTNIDEKLERMNYLHKRLKAFREPEVVTEEIKAGNVAANNAWPTANA